MKIKEIVIMTILFVLIAGLSACSEPDTGEAKELSQAVIIAKPTTKSFSKSFETVSEAEAYKKAFIIPKISANIVKFLSDEGDFVKRGQALVKLDRRDYSIAVEAAEAQVSAAEARVLQARVTYDKVLADYERLKKLRQKDSISQTEYEEIKAALKQSEAAVSAAEAQEKAARSNLKSAERQLSYTTLYAPFSGYISMRNGETGEIASPQNPKPMFEIVQSRKLKIDVFVSELDIAAINEETQAKVSFDAFPGETVKAEVEFVNSKVEKMTKSVKVRFLVGNEKNRFKPGMTVRIGIELPETEHLVIPRNAVFTRDNEAGIVYIKDENDKVSTKDIMLGGNVDGYSIVSSGLEGDETIVVGGGRRLEDGSEVTVIEVLDSN